MPVYPYSHKYSRGSAQFSEKSDMDAYNSDEGRRALYEWSFMFSTRHSAIKGFRPNHIPSSPPVAFFDYSNVFFRDNRSINRTPTYLVRQYSRNILTKFAAFARYCDTEKGFNKIS